VEGERSDQPGEPGRRGLSGLAGAWAGLGACIRLSGANESNASPHCVVASREALSFAPVMLPRWPVGTMKGHLTAAHGVALVHHVFERGTANMLRRATGLLVCLAHPEDHTERVELVSVAANRPAGRAVGSVGPAESSGPPLDTLIGKFCFGLARQRYCAEVSALLARDSDLRSFLRATTRPSSTMELSSVALRPEERPEVESHTRIFSWIEIVRPPNGALRLGYATHAISDRTGHARIDIAVLEKQGH
jgi:hypothetical protein